MKLLVIAGSLLLVTGCQIQVNFGSSVINVPISKTQVGKGQEMTGSDIEDAGKGALKQKSEAHGSLK